MRAQTILQDALTGYVRVIFAPGWTFYLRNLALGKHENNRRTPDNLPDFSYLTKTTIHFRGSNVKLPAEIGSALAWVYVYTT